jgi:DNA repair exonuclease SbcCD ATPase subunit
VSTNPTSHRIRSISVIGGFLDGARFELADELNCFIGARGTGKTTALEFVRYALDALPGREDQPSERRRIESLVERNLAGGRVEITIETKDGLAYIISRAAGEEPPRTGVTHEEPWLRHERKASRQGIREVAQDRPGNVRDERGSGQDHRQMLNRLPVRYEEWDY